MSDLQKKETVFKLGSNTVKIEHDDSGRAASVLVYPSAGIGIGTRFSASDAETIATAIREINDIVACRDAAVGLVGSIVKAAIGERPEGGIEDERGNDDPGRESNGCYGVGPGEAIYENVPEETGAKTPGEKEPREEAESDHNDHG
jgi:hypothetical protein